MRKEDNKGELRLWQYYEDCGRMGSLECLFIMSREELFDRYIDRVFWWGELLGKHSEGHFNLSVDTITDLEVPEEVAKVLLGKVGKVISGDLDFDYFDEVLEEASDGEDE